MDDHRVSKENGEKTITPPVQRTNTQHKQMNRRKAAKQWLGTSATGAAFSADDPDLTRHSRAKL
jgi:hypothetical protein